MLTYRKARAEDQKLAAEYIYGSARDLFDFTFPEGTAVDFIAFDFSRKKGIFGRDWLTVVTSEEKVVGTLTSYPGRKFLSLSAATFMSICKFYGPIRTVGILNKLRILGPLFIRPGARSVYIANGFVAEGHRKHGVFAGLVEAAVDFCEKSGLEAIECDISETNKISLEVHRGLGFEVQEIKTYTGNHPLLAGFIRMRLYLL